MKRAPRILPECYCDTLLIELLLRVIPNHQTSGVGQVLKIIEKNFSKQKAVGVIDDDKAFKKYKASFFNEFIPQKTANNLVLKKHPKKDNYLIMLSPALEKFLLNAANDCGIPPDEIPFSEKELKRISKSIYVNKNQKLKQFINQIIQKKSPGTETLKQWIEEILGEEF